MTESVEAPLVRVLLRPFPLLGEGLGAVGSEIGARVQRGQRVATRFAVGTGGVRRVGHISQARRSLRQARRARERHRVVQRAAGVWPLPIDDRHEGPEVLLRPRQAWLAYCGSLGHAMWLAVDGAHLRAQGHGEGTMAIPQRCERYPFCERAC